MRLLTNGAGKMSNRFQAGDRFEYVEYQKVWTGVVDRIEGDRVWLLFDEVYWGRRDNWQTSCTDGRLTLVHTKFISPSDEAAYRWCQSQRAQS